MRRQLFKYFGYTFVYTLISRELAAAWSVKLSAVLRSVVLPYESLVLYYFDFGNYIVFSFASISVNFSI